LDPNEISCVIAILHLINIEAGRGIFVPNGILKRLELFLALCFAFIGIAGAYKFYCGPVRIYIDERIIPCVRITVPCNGSTIARKDRAATTTRVQTIFGLSFACARTSANTVAKAPITVADV
jgi:hypothetical protein